MKMKTNEYKKTTLVERQVEECEWCHEIVDECNGCGEVDIAFDSWWCHGYGFKHYCDDCYREKK